MSEPVTSPRITSISRSRTVNTVVDTDKSRRLRLMRMPTWAEFVHRHKSPKPVGDAPGFIQQFKAVITMSWLNLFLVFIPLSWAFHFAKLNNTLIFVFSFLAIVPLAQLLAFSTEELSIRLGQTLAGLLNATLGNAVELIVAIIALTQCELQVVQSSLVGSILSNLLLVLGMCFVAGGTKFSEQGFGISATQLNASLLTLSVIGVLLPAAFHLAVEPSSTTGSDPLTNEAEGKDILSISHGVAIILLFIYVCYLFFQLFSHKDLYSDDHPNVVRSVKYNLHPERNSEKSTDNKSDQQPAGVSSALANRSGSTDHAGVTTMIGDSATTGEGSGSQTAGDAEAASQHSEEEHKPTLSVQFTIALLVVITVLVAVTAEFLVSSIDGLTSTGKISKEFVGLILLPIVGNAAEHVTAVTVSVKDKLTLSLGVAVGSSIQIALFVIPFIVTLGWILGKPLTLLFDPFESIVLFLSVLTVNYVVQDGKSNWLEGMILVCLYVICAVVFWYYPGTDPASVLASCS